MLPLHVPPEMVAQIGHYGDIVTLGSKDNPARDRRAGILVPHDQRFMLVDPALVEMSKGSGWLK